MSHIKATHSDSSASEDTSCGDLTDDFKEGPAETKSRHCRNLLEKKRRDKYNRSIEDLRTMVCEPSGKMDKLSVLKATVAYMKAHNEQEVPPEQKESRADWKPDILSDEEFSYMMLDAMDGFIIAISEIGKIMYVSESVTSLLGHLPAEILNSTIYDYLPTMEKSSLAKILNTHPETGSKVEHTLTLSIRLGQLESGTEKTKYQLVKFNGHYKRFIPIPNGEDLDTKCIFVCIGRLLDSDLLRDMSMVVDSASNTEFCSKQSMEWKFVYVDDRAPSIIGYSSFELLGNSGYDYIHVEDVENLAAGHKQLMRNGIGTSCYHRFLTKGQQWIWLQSRYRITINPRTSVPDSVSCIHRVVSYVEVMKDLRKKSASSPTGFDLPKVEVSEPASHRRNSSPLNIGNSHRLPTTMLNSRAPAPMRSMTNLDPMLAPYIQTSMHTTSACQPLALPVAAFYLNPIPTPSASALVGYSSGILLAPSFQEQLLLNQAGPQNLMMQHHAEQFRRAFEPIHVRQSDLFENGQPISNQRICRPSHVSSIPVQAYHANSGPPLIGFPVQRWHVSSSPVHTYQFN